MRTFDTSHRDPADSTCIKKKNFRSFLVRSCVSPLTCYVFNEKLVSYESIRDQIRRASLERWLRSLLRKRPRSRRKGTVRGAKRILGEIKYFYKRRMRKNDIRVVEKLSYHRPNGAPTNSVYPNLIRHRKSKLDVSAPCSRARDSAIFFAIQSKQMPILYNLTITEHLGLYSTI